MMLNIDSSMGMVVPRLTWALHILCMLPCMLKAQFAACELLSRSEHGLQSALVTTFMLCSNAGYDRYRCNQLAARTISAEQVQIS